MFTVNELKKIKFSKSAMGGYRANEVDDFITDVTSDFAELLKTNQELQKKVKVLAQKVDEYRQEEDSIKGALVSAKQLGDKIVNEAKAEAEALTSDAKIKAESTLSEAKASSEQMLKDAEKRSKTIIDDAKRESVELEESLKLQCLKERKRLDVMKSLVSKFKAEIIESYKQHIEMLKTLPEVESEESTNPEETPDPIAEEPKVNLEDISSDPAEEIIDIEPPKAEEKEEDVDIKIEDKMPINEILADISGETITFSKKFINGDDEEDDEDEETVSQKEKDPYIPSIDIVSYEAESDEDDTEDDTDDDDDFGFSEDNIFSDGFNIDTNAFDDDDDDDDDGGSFGFFKSRK